MIYLAIAAITLACLVELAAIFYGLATNWMGEDWDE